jgi:hypothetical protein
VDSSADWPDLGDGGFVPRFVWAEIHCLRVNLNTVADFVCCLLLRASLVKCRKRQRKNRNDEK